VILGRKNIVLTAFVLICLLPLLMGFVYSLGYSLGVFGLMNEGFTLDHWLRLFASKDAWSSLIYTFLLTLVSITLVIVFAGLLSRAFVSKPERSFTQKLLLLPLLFAPVAAGFAWYYVLSPAGILSRISHALGLTEDITSFPRMVNDDWSIGILLVHVFLVLPIFTFLFTAQAKSMNLLEMNKLATSLGSSRLQCFTKLWLPALVKRFKLLIVLYAVFFMGTYEVPLILGQSSPRVLTVFISEKLTMFSLDDIPLGHCMAVFYSACIFIVLSFFLYRQKSTAS